MYQNPFAIMLVKDVLADIHDGFVGSDEAPLCGVLTTQNFAVTPAMVRRCMHLAQQTEHTRKTSIIQVGGDPEGEDDGLEALTELHALLRETSKTPEQWAASLTKAYAALACERARKAGPRRVLVAGCLPPLTDCYDPCPGSEKWEEHYAMLAGSLVEGGVDVLLGETVATLDAGRCIIAGCAKAGVTQPLWLSVVPRRTGGGVGLLDSTLLGDAVKQWAEMSHAGSVRLALIMANCGSLEATEAACEKLSQLAVPMGAYASFHEDEETLSHPPFTWSDAVAVWFPPDDDDSTSSSHPSEQTTMVPSSKASPSCNTDPSPKDSPPPSSKDSPIQMGDIDVPPNGPSSDAASMDDSTSTSDGESSYKLLANAFKDWDMRGARVIGGCCDVDAATLSEALKIARADGLRISDPEIDDLAPGGFLGKSLEIRGG